MKKNAPRYLGFAAVFILLIFMSLCVSGCALFEIPAKLIEGTFGLVGELLKIAEQLPTPPPGVFGN